MKTLAVVVVAILGWLLISKLVDLARPPPETRQNAVAAPDAIQTKLAVTQQVALQTPIAVAARTMAANGFQCRTVAHASYTDMTEQAGEQARGPADILSCDAGGQHSDRAFASRRWQVIFEDEGGRVARVSVGVAPASPSGT